jgi:predicted neuraminidase
MAKIFFVPMWLKNKLSNELPRRLLLALFGFAPLALAAGATAGLVRSEFIFERASFPSCHASTIVETKEGLLAAWFGGTAEQNPDVCIYAARNENGSWTAPVEVANGAGFAAKSFPTWNPVLFQPTNGPLLLFYKVGPSPSQWWGMLMVSTDDGKTWSKPSRLPEGIVGPVKNKPVQLASGEILCASSTEDKDRWSVHFERTSDFGKSWTRTPPVNDGMAIQAIQPSILFLGGDKLLAVGRSRQDHLFQIASDDDGKTWGTMSLATLPNPNSGTDAVTLKDGRHLVIYNHAAGIRGQWRGSRTPLNAAISRDGISWMAALLLESGPGEYSYPAVIQTSDGLVHITYTWNRQRIRHIIVDPARLAPRPFVNEQWPQ